VDQSAAPQNIEADLYENFSNKGYLIFIISQFWPCPDTKGGFVYSLPDYCAIIIGGNPVRIYLATILFPIYGERILIL
jgi:hypothetical protein